MRTGEKPSRCDSCVAHFAQSGSLKKPSRCDSCVAHFAQSGSLKKPSKCDSCVAHFAQSGSLKKPSRCDSCVAHFAQSGSLKKPVCIHTEECNTCGNQFDRLVALVVTGEITIWQCDICLVCCVMNSLNVAMSIAATAGMLYTLCQTDSTFL